MNENNMEDLLKNFNNMLKNNDIPDEFKNIINNLGNSSESSSNSEDTATNDFDIDPSTILKVKKMMDSINSNKPDPRANLLRSLKPYLKESRQKKVDQYIQLFNMEKVFECFSSLGGDNKDDV